MGWGHPLPDHGQTAWRVNHILGCEPGQGCVGMAREGSAGDAVPPNRRVGSVRMRAWFP